MARAKLASLIGDLHDSLTALIVKVIQDNREWLAEQFEDVKDSVNRVAPIHVDMTPELANGILDKMRGPMTIPQDVSDAIRKGAGKYGQWFNVPLTGIAMALMARADGTMDVEFKDYETGEIRYRGTFVPPDYRKEDT